METRPDDVNELSADAEEGGGGQSLDDAFERSPSPVEEQPPSKTPKSGSGGISRTKAFDLHVGEESHLAKHEPVDVLEHVEASSPSRKSADAPLSGAIESLDVSFVPASYERETRSRARSRENVPLSPLTRGIRNVRIS